MGNLANQMIQYMVAVRLSDEVVARGGARPAISNVDLAPFGIHHPLLAHDPAATCCVTSAELDLSALADTLASGTFDCVDIRSYAQKIVNFPGLARARELFAQDQAGESEIFDDELLCSIRGGEILDARHPDYVLIPPLYYADLARVSGLRPVFMGQIEGNAYIGALRALFPEARFLPSEGAARDFARIRQARHVVPAISTFSWLAAWLGEAETIYLPVLGLFNPLQSPGTDLLPAVDQRFRFYQFPFHFAVPIDQVARAHTAIGRSWRPVMYSQIHKVAARPRDLASLLTQFDEQEYRSLHPDVGAAVDGGHFPSARHHFIHHGFGEGRAPFLLDAAYYCTEYGLAAREMSEGDYPDLWHHYVLTGHDRGYRRTCPAPDHLSGPVE